MKLFTRKGVTMIEYALLAALISIIGITAIKSISVKVKTTFENVDTAL